MTQFSKQNLTLTETARLFEVARETVTNWVREGLLRTDARHRVTQASIRRFQQKYAGKVKLQSRANKLHKAGMDVWEVKRLIHDELRQEAFDERLGDHYEQLLSESYKNKEGIFYTPMNIVDDMMKDVRADADTLFLDPGCGTGNFLVKAVEKGVSPQNLYGFDTDPTAVAIAQRRIKELTGQDAPHVVCADFLEECPALNVRFDLIFGNPPWGKKLPKADRNQLVKRYRSGTSIDTCSLFLYASLSVLKADGLIGMLMPESFFNIATYENVRKTVLDMTVLTLKDYGKRFGNMYSACSILIRNAVSDGLNEVTCFSGNLAFKRMQRDFASLPRHILNYWTGEQEMAYIEQLLQQPHLTLKDHASWGLGIVTGNNTALCKHNKREGYLPVYRGKDIHRGELRPASVYLNPNDFPRYQQMASLELLHAPVKLVYRFISNDLVFCCDTQQRYFLNSANMLVLDEDFPLTAVAVTDIMNSPLTNWLFKQLFHTHKVLRGDLEVLPLFNDSALHRGFDLLHFDR